MGLKVFTQKEFDAIPRDSIGHKVCPTGNYSQIMEAVKEDEKNH